MKQNNVYEFVRREIPKIEAKIAVTERGDFRNQVVARLAALDQKMAALRDRLR